MRHALPFVLLILLTACLAGTARAREVVLSVGTSMPPYVMSDRDMGLEVDIVREALRLAGHTVSTRYAPLARVPMQLQDGVADAALTINRETAPGLRCYSDSHITYHNVAISLAKNGFSIESLADLKGKSVTAFQRADLRLGCEYQDAIEQTSKYRETADQTIQLNLLFSGRTDVIVIERHIFRTLLYETPPSDEIDLTQEYVIHPIFPPTHYNVGFNDSGLCREFNTALRQLRSTGRYDELKAAYLGE